MICGVDESTELVCGSGDQGKRNSVSKFKLQDDFVCSFKLQFRNCFNCIVL